MRRAVPLIFLPLLLLLPPRAEACNRSLEISGNLRHRQYGLSEAGPVARRLRDRPDLREQVEPLTVFMRRLFVTVDSRIQRNDSRACNLARDPWITSGYQSSKARQVALYRDTCDSRIDGNEAVANNELDRQFVQGADVLIRNAKNALFEALKHIPQISNPALNWTSGPFPLRDWDLRRLSQQCTVESAHAYRINGTMYLSAFATNEPVNAFLEDSKRQYIQESIAEDFQSSLPLCQPEYGTHLLNDLTGVKNISATTLLTTLGGKATLAAHGDMDFDTNPAILEAMRLNEIAVDQAEDAITPSNIAILALPMAMSLIPVAFLADLNTCATLWYIIFTDIFSALPFLIKGVELFQSAKVRRGEMVAFHIGDSTAGELEVWAAECSGDESFRTLGIVFITIAVMAIVIGVLLELFAGMLMRRRRNSAGREAEGPFGMAAFDTTAYSLLGSAKDEEKERRYSMEGDLYDMDHSMAEKGLFLRLRKKISDESDASDKQSKKEKKAKQKSERSDSNLKRNSKDSEERAGPPGLGSDGLTGAERAEINERQASDNSSREGSDRNSFGGAASLLPGTRTSR